MSDRSDHDYSDTVNLKSLQRHWDAFGRTDPLWAVLTQPDKRGGRWDLEEFFATGKAEITAVMDDLRALGCDPPRRCAIDFGCGVGRLTQALAAHFELVFGVDIAPSMLELARRYDQKEGRCRYVLNTGIRLDAFTDASVDLIYTNIVLQHLEPRHVKGYLREFLRILSPDGVLVFQLPTVKLFDDEAPARGAKVALRRATPRPLLRAYRAVRRWFEFPRMEGHGISRPEVEAYLRRLGAEIVDVRPDSSAGPQWEAFRYCVRRRREGRRGGDS